MIKLDNYKVRYRKAVSPDITFSVDHSGLGWKLTVNNWRNELNQEQYEWLKAHGFHFILPVGGIASGQPELLGEFPDKFAVEVFLKVFHRAFYQGKYK